MEPDNKREKRKYKRGQNEGGGYIGGFLAIAMIVAIFLGIKYLSTSSDDVKGARSNALQEQKLDEEAKKAKENVKGDINKQIDKIKEDIDNLNALDVTTKSPQVKKIIDDLNSLQNLPKDQAKNACQQICTNFE